MKRYLINQNGMVLPIVLIIIAVLMMLTTALVKTSNFETKQSRNHEKRLQAYYLAMSGADVVGAWIENANTQEIVNDLKGRDSGWQILEQDVPGEVRIEVEGTEQPYLINVKATGKVDDVTERITLILVGHEVFPDPELPPEIEWQRHWSRQQ